MLAHCCTLYAQDIKFTASAPQVVGLDDRFEVSFTVNTTNASNFKAPTFRGVQVLSGPHQSQSTSMSFINGRQSGSSKLTFSFYLKPLSVGTVNIAPAKITVSGTVYQSNPISIRVDKSTPSSNQQKHSQNNYYQSPNTPSSSQQQQKTDIKLDDKALFIRAIPNKTTAVPGEQIVLTYKLYTLVNVSQYQIERSPVSKGFWLEELDAQQQPQMSHETYEGRQYNVATIRKVLVFPQQEGKLTIEPLAIEVTAYVQTRTNRGRQSTGDPFFDSFFNDPFFSSMFSVQNQPIQKKLSSNSVTINVKSLPNAPQNYIGAVGKFSLSSEIDRNECRANEAISLKYTLSGSGNITLIDKLPLKLPSDFEVYEPTITDNIQKNENGISGTRTFEYIIIPRQEGKFSLDSMHVSFYDTETKQYKTLSTPSYNLSISRGKDNDYQTQQRSEREKYRKMDIKPLQHINIAKNISLNAFESIWFWLSFIFIVGFTIAFILYYRQKLEMNKDIKAVRLRKANRVALKRLKKAKDYLIKREDEAFIDEISKSIWCYLEDKFGIERYDLCMEKIVFTLNLQQIDKTITDNLVSLLAKTEMLRFSSDKSFEENENLYTETLTLISNLESELKLKR